MLQLHKTNNLFTSYKDHKEARACKQCNISFMYNQWKWGNRPSLETPLFKVPAGLAQLSARTGNVTAGKEDFCELWKCSSCDGDGSLTQVQLWLQLSKALKSHWLCFSETHLSFAQSLLLNCTWDWTRWHFWSFRGCCQF